MQCSVNDDIINRTLTHCPNYTSVTSVQNDDTPANRFSRQALVKFFRNCKSATAVNAEILSSLPPRQDAVTQINK